MTTQATKTIGNRLREDHANSALLILANCGKSVPATEILTLVGFALRKGDEYIHNYICCAINNVDAEMRRTLIRGLVSTATVREIADVLDDDRMDRHMNKIVRGYLEVHGAYRERVSRFVWYVGRHMKPRHFVMCGKAQAGLLWDK